MLIVSLTIALPSPGASRPPLPQGEDCSPTDELAQDIGILAKA